MKTAYELAMERLNQTAPLKKLTEEQKKRIAETDARYRAKIAEKEIAFQGKIEAARNAGDFEAMNHFTVCQTLIACRRVDTSNP